MSLLSCEGIDLSQL